MPRSFSGSSPPKVSSTTRAELRCSLDEVRIEIGADPPELLRDIASRLRAFPPTDGKADAFVELTASDNADAVIPRPQGPARSLFEAEHELEYYPESGLLYLADTNIVAECDLAGGVLRIAVRANDPRAVFLASHLFLTLPLLEILKRHERFAVHAGGVALRGRCVLFPGVSGAGKSTLVLACVRAGWDFLGDDLVLLRDSDGADLQVHGFPDEIDLTEESLRFFPELMATADATRRWPKHRISPLDVPHLRLASSVPPAALVFPLRVAGRARLVPVSADEALVALVPNVIRTERRTTQRHLDVLATLARTVPAYHLEIADPLAAPSLLLDLIDPSSRH